MQLKKKNLNENWTGRKTKFQFFNKKTERFSKLVKPNFFLI